jgi:hypothetical protein
LYLSHKIIYFVLPEYGFFRINEIIYLWSGDLILWNVTSTKLFYAFYNKDINAPYRNYSVIANMIAIWHPGMSIFTSYYKQRLEYNINKSLIGKDNCLVLI